MNKINHCVSGTGTAKTFTGKWKTCRESASLYVHMYNMNWRGLKH